ncbi:MAG: hypothetical protein ACTSR5_18805 [Promethearchaeota archaeon]
MEANYQAKESEVATLNEKNANLTADLDDLKSELNNAMSLGSESQEKTTQLSNELQELKSKLESTQSENANLQSQLQEFNDLLLKKDGEISNLSDSIGEKEKLIEAQTSLIEEVETELSELKPPEIGSGGFVSDERVTCPMCGAVGQNIKQIEDKGKVLSYVGHIPMYAKKHVCKKCGYEF